MNPDQLHASLVAKGQVKPISRNNYQSYRPSGNSGEVPCPTSDQQVLRTLVVAAGKLDSNEEGPFALYTIKRLLAEWNEKDLAPKPVERFTDETPLAMCGLSERTINYLEAAGIFTLGAMIEAYGSGKVAAIKGVGPKIIAEVQGAILKARNER